MTPTNLIATKYPQTIPDSFDLILGPSFQNEMAPAKDWQHFVGQINDPISHKFAQLWATKAQMANGVPKRQDFTFDDLVAFGPNLILYKLDESGKWLTTFCGTKVVEILGMELTGKYMNDYGTDATLTYWLDNIKYVSGQSRPILERYDLEFVDKKYIRCTSINLPLMTGTGPIPDSYFEIMAFGPEQAPKNTDL